MGDISSRILFLYFLAGLLIMPFWMKLSYFIGKSKTLLDIDLTCAR